MRDMPDGARPRSLVQHHPDAVEAMVPLLRVGNLARFRLLDVLCPRYHRLAQVLQTSVGPVIYAKGQRSEGWGVVTGEIYDGTREVLDMDWSYRHRGDKVVYRLEALLQNNAESREFIRKNGLTNATPHQSQASVQCRCTRADIPAAWIAEQIASGTRRTIWIPPT